MAKVLVVDDERSYSEYLGMFLARERHAVRTAATASEAIELGTRFRPDVLVVDWMLRNHVHGLQVSEALGAMLEDLKTVLITAFPSRDLKAAAERARIFAFVQKPFEVEEIQDTVREAARSPGTGDAGPALAVAEADEAGGILFANPAARELFQESGAGREAASFGELFGVDGAPDPEAAADRWVPAQPRAPRSLHWESRTQRSRAGGTRLWIFRRRGERVSAALTEMLLGVEEPRQLRWPFPSRVLVVDDDDLFRHVAVAILESAGASAYAVETEGEALRLLEHDEGLSILLLDYELGEAGHAQGLIERVGALRPDVAIVGNSAFDRRAEFAAAGVERFLRKPWRPADLVGVLEDAPRLSAR